MKGNVAIGTGAAGGIGGELCKLIYSLGGTVVALDRNIKGLEELQSTLQSSNEARGNEENGNDGGKIVTIQTHHDDLSSVASTAEEIKSRFQSINLLINNAGLTYPKDANPGQQNMLSAHGNDLSFTVNYLCHFLLTEKMIWYR